MTLGGAERREPNSQPTRLLDYVQKNDYVGVEPVTLETLIPNRLGRSVVGGLGVTSSTKIEVSERGGAW